MFNRQGTALERRALRAIHVATCLSLTTPCACCTAAQHSQQERARAQVMAEEAAAAWRSAFAETGSQQQAGGDPSGASGVSESSLLAFAADIDDPLLQVSPVVITRAQRSQLSTGRNAI